MKRLHPQLLIAAIATVTLQCSDRGTVAPENVDLGPPPPQGMVISNSHSTLPSSAEPGVSFSTTGDGISYVSLAPRTLPNAVRVQIQNRKRNAPATMVPVVDGGFDPVAIQASVGDTLDLAAVSIDGTTQPMTVRVPPKRPPSVVRTRPAKGLTDVALTVVVTVVFTEPVDLKTVDASSLQLLHGATHVSGKIVLTENSWDVRFAPDTPLEPNSVYQVVVTTGIRDLDGDPVEQSYSSSFTTGIRLCDGRLVGSECEALPIQGDNIVTGTVIARSGQQTWPVPNSTISPWVLLDDGRAYTLAPIQSDENGKYTLTSLPAAAVQLHATADGLDQPCGVLTHASRPAPTTDIELFPSGSPAVDHTSSFEIWGFVYDRPDEQSGKPVPISGVRVAWESPENFVAATATTDANGNFDLCRLSSFGRPMLSMVKSGYGAFRDDIGLEPGRYEIWKQLWPTP